MHPVCLKNALATNFVFVAKELLGGYTSSAMFNKLREIKDKAAMAKKLMDLQKKVSAISVEGTSGWGKVKVMVNGLQQMQSCSIDPELASDVKKLESLIVEAVNDAHKKLQSVMAERMKDLGGEGLGEEFGDLLKQ